MIKTGIAVFCCLSAALTCAADISITGRGSIETDAFSFDRTYGKDANGRTDRKKYIESMSLFGSWNTEDSDLWVRGDWEMGGFNLNLSFDGVGKHISSNVNGETVSLPAPLQMNDWTVWLTPVDIYRPVPNLDKLFHFAFTLMATSEANRRINRYNDIIDKTESKWGVLLMGQPGMDMTWGKNAATTDDDAFKGYIISFDATVVNIDLGFNSGIIDNTFDLGSSVIAKTDELTKVAGGLRLYMPFQRLLNVSLFAKTAYLENKTDSRNDGVQASFGAIFDITAIENMGIAVGYFGHWQPLTPPVFSGKGLTVDVGIKDMFINAVDFRLQLKSGFFGFALHNNITFGLAAGNELLLGEKGNLGFSFDLTPDLSLITELQYYLWWRNEPSAKAQVMFQTITIYPRFALSIVRDRVNLGFGIRADADPLPTVTESSVRVPGSSDAVPPTSQKVYTTYAQRISISIPISLEVIL